ncbi:hypothetical protein D9757_006845 [Collybiopsis confluens]|uniref:Uncharacterized protein n=1 Tax=Collybiopsis confluens TaxID=2823264 RepID=A0A8H5HQ95_9AGAR|nr:hypothetical protein D9757_006845 [Collybiopsis confluens]
MDWARHKTSHFPYMDAVTAASTHAAVLRLDIDLPKRANVLFLLETSSLLGPRGLQSMFIVVAKQLFVLSVVAFSTSETCDGWKKFVSVLSVIGRAAIVVLGAGCVIADAFHVPSEKCVNSSDPPIDFTPFSFDDCFRDVRRCGYYHKNFPGVESWRPMENVISILTTASVILDLRAPVQPFKAEKSAQRAKM